MSQSIEEKGILANVALVIGLTAGRLLPEDTFGLRVSDGEGRPHAPLTRIGHHVRKAGQSKLRALREKLLGIDGVFVVDYTEDAAPADYDAYSRALAEHSGEAIVYRAVYVYGPEELVLPLTKNLSKL